MTRVPRGGSPSDQAKEPQMDSIVDNPLHRVPRHPKGSQKWDTFIIPWIPQYSNGSIFGGFHFLDPSGVWLWGITTSGPIKLQSKAEGQ